MTELRRWIGTEATATATVRETARATGTGTAGGGRRPGGPPTAPPTSTIVTPEVVAVAEARGSPAAAEGLGATTPTAFLRTPLPRRLLLLVAKGSAVVAAAAPGGVALTLQCRWVALDVAGFPAVEVLLQVA